MLQATDTPLVHTPPDPPACTGELTSAVRPAIISDEPCGDLSPIPDACLGSVYKLSAPIT
jgi:hypothetical protein